MTDPAQQLPCGCGPGDHEDIHNQCDGSPHPRCVNCQHDARQTPARWLTTRKRLPVCDEHKAFHERIGALIPLYYPRPRTPPQFVPIQHTQAA